MVILYHYQFIKAMNRPKPILLFIIISLLPLSLAFGQEKKNEEKVKVIIADKSGTKVVLDTTFTTPELVDTIILKDGKTIRIINYEPDVPEGPHKQVSVIAHVDKDGKNTGRQYVYINKGKAVSHSGDGKFDVFVSDDVIDNETDKTKYVIAKNGIVVSIEGNDEAKIKELVKEIENRLEINKESDSASGSKDVGKSVSKKK